jgi:hypothetical protein
MSTANDALLYNLAISGFPVTDDAGAPNANSQSTGTPVVGDLLRVVTSVSNGSVTLKSSVSNDAPPLCFVVNDSPNTIKVYPFSGESLNGTLNLALSVPSGQSGIFVRIPPATSRGGGGGGTVDWRAAVIP